MAVRSMAAELYVFDFETERVQKIEDGRIKRSRMNICQVPEGFALFVRPTFDEGTIYLLDQQGQFKDSLRLADFTGAQPKGDIQHVCNGPAGKLLATIGYGEQSERVTLYEVDLAAKRFTELQTFVTGEQDAASYWAASNEELCFVSPFSARIRTVGADYLPARTVLPGRPLVENEPSRAKLPADLKAVAKQPLFLRYKPQIPSVYELQDSITLKLVEHTEEKVDEIVLGRKVRVNKINKTFFSYRHGSLQKNQVMVIGTYGKKSLCHDEEEQIFEVRTQ